MFNIRVEDAERAGYIKNRYYKGGTSFPEQFIFRSLLQVFPRAESRLVDSDLELEFDIVVPELSLRIEYSGSYWHATKDKQYRDQKRREFCKCINATYVEVIEKCGANRISLQKEGNHLVYNIFVSSSYSNKINGLIEIIEDLMYHFEIYNVKIDYTRAMYEAFMLSTPYHYNLIKDDENNIVGKKYTEQVYSNYYIKNNSSNKELKSSGNGLKIVPIERKTDTLIQEDYEMLNQLMFSGKPIEVLSVKSQEEIDFEDKEAKIVQMQRQLENERKVLENERKMLENERKIFDREKKKVVCKKEKVMEIYKQLLEKRKILNKEMFKINNERSNAILERNKFENNLKEEYSRKLDEITAKMEVEIREREKRACNYEITQLKNKIKDEYALIDELNAQIRGYKNKICRYELDLQARMGGRIYVR